MTDQGSGATYAMLLSAANAAKACFDFRGRVCPNLTEKKAAFLRRKSCRGLSREVCSHAFDKAIGIAELTYKFRRTRCGQLPPTIVQRYELLLALATELKTAYPDENEFLITFACNSLQMQWDR